MSEWLGFFDPAQVQTEAEMRSTVEDVHNTIVQLGSKDEKMQREAINHFLNRLHDNILAAQSSPKSKLMSLLMLRELSEKGMRSDRKQDKNSKLFSLLMTSKMFKHLTYLCQTVDPRKPITDKGKSFFTSDSAVGNDFIRLILELVKFWADRYPQTKNRQPTAYKRAYDALLEAKVIFPTDYKFFTITPTSRKDKRQEEAGESVPVLPKTNKVGKTESTRSNPKADVNFMHNRLQNFLQILDEDDISLIDTEIRTVHALIEKQYPKYERMSDEIIDTNDEEVIHKYFNIRELMQKQLQFHARYIDINKDFNSYITEVKLEAEKLFPYSSNTPQPQENKPKRNDAPPIPPKDRPTAIQIPEQEIKGGNVSNITKKLPVNNSNPGGKINNAPVKQSAVDPAALTAVSNYFTRLEERSKSPIAGFKKINESLSKEKANTLTSAVKRSISPLSRSKNSINKSMASLKQSKIAPIFTNPPNPSPPRKQYDGKQIRENFALSDAMHSIHKSQGVRRFKTANFKSKSSLFENEHIQIGYKSQPIYQEVSGFKVLMKIELFFGNLGEETIKGVNLEFKGDPNVLLYANPKIISNILPKSEQSRLELIVIPIKAPFPLLTMNLTYQFGGQQNEYKVLIPNSMLKLTHFLDLSKSEFNNRWTTCELHRTDTFKLCHYLAPDTFKKWFPALGELTSYTTFATPGSTQDYELYCSVIMMQHYEGLLKINIRPNLEVVVQLGIEDHNEQSVSYFLFFLQTMQQFLAEVE